MTYSYVLILSFIFNNLAKSFTLSNVLKVNFLRFQSKDLKPKCFILLKSQKKYPENSLCKKLRSLLPITPNQYICVTPSHISTQNRVYMCDKTHTFLKTKYIHFNLYQQSTELFVHFNNFYAQYSKIEHPKKKESADTNF